MRGRGEWELGRLVRRWLVTPWHGMAMCHQVATEGMVCVRVRARTCMLCYTCVTLRRRAGHSQVVQLSANTAYVYRFGRDASGALVGFQLQSSLRLLQWDLHQTESRTDAWECASYAASHAASHAATAF